MKELQLNEIEQVNGGVALATVLIVGGVIVLVGSALAVGIYLGYKEAEASAKK